MTCNCKAELASIIKECAVYWADHKFNDKANTTATVLHDLAARLSPPPAKEEGLPEVPPEWASRGVEFVRTSPAGGNHWFFIKMGDLFLSGGTEHSAPAKWGRVGGWYNRECYTEALAAAPRPGESEPAPASTAFDPEKMVLDKITRINDRDCLCYGNFLPGVPASTLGNTQMAVKAIVELMLVAEAAGYTRAKAEQKPRKWPEGAADARVRVLRWHAEGFWYTCSACNMRDGAWWLPQPAPPAADQEPRP